jgi:glycosyltransferase involved in cell wall biosynthesis
MFIPKFGTCNLACSSLAAKYFFGTKDCTIIKNGVDTNGYKFNPEPRSSLRKKYNISPSTHVLGHIGRFDEVKNHKFLLDIFDEYYKRNRDSKLMLVGEGHLEEQVREKVKTLGLEDNVIFLGVRNDIPDILCAMDCFVMPSLYEGLPFVLVEAQASGLPCVISDTINQDSRLAPYLKFRGLNDDLSLWVDDIKGLIGENNREEGAKYVKEQGFDILSTVQYLEHLYAPVV